jgi:hypothetical protein
MNFRRFHGAAPIYFFLITIWLTWPLTPRLSTGLSSSADSLLNFWALGWSYHVLPIDPLALFDANIFAPRPDTLAYSEHLFGTVLLVAPVYLATGSLVLSYNAAFFLSFVLSGMGMYLLTRDLTQNRWAALAAGTIYLAAPYRFGHLLQLQLLSLQWFPFVFWCLLRFLRHGRVSSLAGVVVFSLLQILSCNYYAVYLAYAVVIFGAAIALFGREHLSARKIVLLAGAAGIVSALALPFLLPYQRNRERGFYRRYEDVVHFSASLTDYWTPSSFNKAPHLRFLPPSTRSEKALFLGFGALALAGIGLARRGGCPRAFWIFVITLSASAIVLSLGPELRWAERTFELPYRFFYRHVPGFSGMRVPARISVLALFGVATLAGLGAAWTLGKARRLEGIAGAGLLGFLLFEYQTYSLERVLPPALEIPAAHRWLGGTTGDGSVLVLPIHEGDEIIEESLYMYYSTSHFLPLVNGYSGWWPNDYWELVGRLRHFPTSRSFRFLLERAPVRYVVVHYGRIREPRRRELEEGMERYRESLPVVFRMGDDVVYEVRRRLDGS